MKLFVSAVGNGVFTDLIELAKRENAVLVTNEISNVESGVKCITPEEYEKTKDVTGKTKYVIHNFNNIDIVGMSIQSQRGKEINISRPKCDKLEVEF